MSGEDEHERPADAPDPASGPVDEPGPDDAPRSAAPSRHPSRAPEVSIDVPPPPLGPGESNEAPEDPELAAELEAAFDAAFDGVVPDGAARETPFASAETVLASMPPAAADTTALDPAPPRLDPPSVEPAAEPALMDLDDPPTIELPPRDPEPPTIEPASLAPGERGFEPPTIEPASALDTVDLEAPDLGDEDPPELSSLVGEIPWQEERRGQLVVIAGGKGGVGRSLITANLGLFLSRLGRAVVLADLDPAGATLHGFMGLDPIVPPAGAAWRAYLPPRIDKLQGALRLCRPGRPLFGGPDDPARVEVFEAAREVAEDLLLIDIGTQVDALSLDLFLQADVAAVVTLPERVAIERTYSFLRQALDRRLLGADDHPAQLARSLISADERGQLDAPPDLVAALSGVEPQAAEAIRARLMAFAPGLVLNRCRTRAERDMATGMCTALRRRWGISPEVLACLDNDDAVFEAARRRRPLVLEYPGSTVSGQIEKLARQVLAKVGARA